MPAGVVFPDAPSSSSRVQASDVVVAAVTAFGIYLGARFTIWSLERLATDLGVPPAILATTVLSVGTTLPELVVSAARIEWTPLLPVARMA